MPQANITYNAPYNRKMVSMIDELDRKHWERAYPAYHPNPMGYRLGSFHGEPVSQIKVGGGSSPEKFLRPGNSPAYPPLHLSAGLAVNSGGSFHQGAKYSSVDGAIGLAHPAMQGSGGFNPFDLGYSFGHDILGPALFGKGQGRKKGGKINLGKAFGSIAKIAEPIAKDVATKVIMKQVGLGRKPRAKKTGGIDVLGAFKSIGHAIGEPVGIATEALAKNELGKAIGLGRKSRSARAEIVKKVMKEKGMKMIEASKYVKAHGLY
jgi:hypothetical protein